MWEWLAVALGLWVVWRIFSRERSAPQEPPKPQAPVHL